MRLEPFPFQKEIIEWSLARDCSAIFADTGLGKALMQLKWATARHEQTGGRVLILAPLAVAAQTEREALKFGINGVAAVRHPADSDAPIIVTNYDRFHLFQDEPWAAIVLDESSILKSVDSKTRDTLTKWAKPIRYRLCCTATPAPNDHTELGNHAEFLGAMTRSQMLGEFFVHDEAEMSVQHWRLKGHAVEAYWRWVAGWAIAVRRPSDLGYEDDGYILPPLKLVHEWLGDARVSDDRLFAVEARTLDERRSARLSSTDDRVAACARAVALEPDEPWIIWCDYNRESEALTKAIPGAVEVRGSDTPEYKETALLWFSGAKCVCHDPLFRTKLQTWRSNDPTLNTCVSTTKPTNTDGRREHQNSRLDTTLAVVRDMPKTPNNEAARLKKPSGGAKQTPKQTSPVGSESTESLQMNTAHFLNPKEEAVLSAVQDSTSTPILEVESRDDFTSTTATELGASEESSAPTATWDSESSATIPTVSNERPCICGHRTGVRTLISKASICGFGLNWQHCARVAFVGLSDSYEQWYQAIRRCWRFGQTRPVEVFVFASEAERVVVDNVQRKAREAEQMMEQITRYLADAREARESADYRRDLAEGDGWALHLGDSAEIIHDLEPESIGLSVFSPPFPGMYVYSASDRDMGNTHDLSEFVRMMRPLAVGLLEATIPGRTCAIHLCQTTAQKVRDGYVGIKDFRGRVIRLMERSGWIYYGEVAIDKDPQLKAIRTKDQGLLFKSLANDSAKMHMALADYVLQFRKPGENPTPIRAGVSDRYGNPDGWITSEQWIEWAAPVWYRATGDYPGGIRETDVLTVREARDDKDERHLAPLQLGVIERCIKLWSAPGETVFSPFAGIGSEGVMALRLDRRFIGVELKPSYWRAAQRNLGTAKAQLSLLQAAQ